MNNNAINILCIEDDPDDIAFLKRAIEGSRKNQTRLTCTGCLRDGLTFLDKEIFDLVLLDLNLPDSQGLETLRTLYRHTNLVPIIIISGSSDETLEIEAIKQGAQDYLIKGKTEGSIIARIITYTIERFRTVQELHASEAQTKTIIENSTDGIIIVDKSGMINFVNPAAEILFGRKTGQLIGKEFGFPVISDCSNEIELIQPNGDTLIVEMRTSELMWENLPAYLISLRDVTERVKAEKLVQSHLHEMEVLYHLSLAINQLQQPKEIGIQIVKTFSDQLHWQYVTLYQYHEDTGTIELLASHKPEMDSDPEKELTEKQQKALSIQPGEGLAGWVIENGQSIYCKDVKNEPRYKEFEKGIQSGIYIPLKIGERTIGCLSVESKSLHAYSESDEWFLSTLSAQVAIALENARLYIDVQHHVDQLLILREIDLAINGSENLQNVIEFVLNHFLKDLAADAAVVFTFDSTKKTLKYVHGKGFRTNSFHHSQLYHGESFTKQVGKGRKIVSLNNFQLPDIEFFRSQSFSEEGFINYYGLPLIAKGRLIGALEIFFRSSFVPTAAWYNFAEALAGQIAIAIDNATLFTDLQQSNLELSQAYNATIEGWSYALDLRDKETEGHSSRVTEMTVKLAQIIGVPESEIIHIYWGALLHDIGKMGVPDSILLKADKLTHDEMVVMQQHPQFAYNMLSRIKYLQSSLDTPYCHHEKWDGSGYPRGLKGEQIPIAARLFAVVDVYDALISDRPYRKAWPKEKALQYIKEQSGKHFDPKAVEAFIRLIEYKKPK